MSDLSKNEKIENILTWTEQFNITAYEIAKNTSLTEAGIGKFLSKKVKNPRISTIDLIFDYITTNYKHALKLPETDINTIKENQLAISTFESMLDKVNTLISRLENVETITVADMTELRKAYKLRDEIAADIRDYKNK